jgi:hypothetical protein
MDQDIELPPWPKDVPAPKLICFDLDDTIVCAHPLTLSPHRSAEEVTSACRDDTKIGHFLWRKWIPGREVLAEEAQRTQGLPDSAVRRTLSSPRAPHAS